VAEMHREFDRRSGHAVPSSVSARIPPGRNVTATVPFAPS
jgi:hypothetical protein